jgi:hypothetical protein
MDLFTFFIFFILFFFSTGGDNLKGVRVDSIRGTDLLSLKSLPAREMDSDIGRQLESLGYFNKIGIISVPVFAEQCTINFQSRSTAGLHFLATYETAKHCPAGYIFNTDIQQCQYVDVSEQNISI